MLKKTINLRATIKKKSWFLCYKIKDILIVYTKKKGERMPPAEDILNTFYCFVIQGKHFLKYFSQ